MKRGVTRGFAVDVFIGIFGGIPLAYAQAPIVQLPPFALSIRNLKLKIFLANCPKSAVFGVAHFESSRIVELTNTKVSHD